MPKKLIYRTTGKIEWEDYQDRELLSTEIKVESQYSSAKHGTEKAIVAGYQKDRFPWNEDLQIFHGDKLQQDDFELGNMFVGKIIELGAEVSMYKKGDIVLGYGGFSELHIVDTSKNWQIWKMPEYINWQSAVCLDPMINALCGIRDGQIGIGDSIAVFGLGAIGLFAIAFAKLSGVQKIYAIDPIGTRRELAKSMGAHTIYDPMVCDVGLEIKKETQGKGVDVAFEYSGARQAMQAALKVLPLSGKVIMGAFPPPYDAGLNFGAESHRNRLEIIFSRADSEPYREHPRWNLKRNYDTCWKLICDKEVDGRDIVRPIVPFDALVEEYPKTISEPDKYLKLGVKH